MEIAGMIIKYLAQTQPGAILAIDADPSSNLNMVLGLDLDWTVGDIRENLLAEVQSSLTASGAAMGTLNGGVTKREYLDYQVRSSLSEGINFDLIAMGRGEGPGCYCAVNHNLREVVDSLSKSYRYVVIDNEAGMEHLSRKTLDKVDLLYFVSDHSVKGLRACRRIRELVEELKLEVGEYYLVVNRYREENEDVLASMVEDVGAKAVFIMPEDPEIIRADATQQSFLELPDTVAAVKAVADIFGATLGEPAGAGSSG